MNKIVVANVMRSKNKQSFFALHQLQSKILEVNPNIDVEFHIIWDSDNTKPEKSDDPKWAALIDTHIINLHSYTKRVFIDYLKDTYRVEDIGQIESGPSYNFLFILAHYLRRVKLYDYFLVYDDDILINGDFSHVTNLMLAHTPVLIEEPMNAACDKALAQGLVNIFGPEFIEVYKHRNPTTIGFNGGFQGIDLGIYDSFLSVDRFHQLLSTFNFKSIYNEDGTELWGQERFIIDTQQQSFFSLMNIVLARNTPHFLDRAEYYVVPNHGFYPGYGDIDPEDELNGWGLLLKSKISHFIGHTQGKGKPKVFLQKVDEYLQEKGFDI